MMTKPKISLFQLFSMMVLFGFGSSSVLGLGMIAKQDAWISVLIAALGGILLLLMYGYIFKNHSETTFVLTLEKVLGKYIGKLIAMFYLIYFMYISTLVLRDIGELIEMYVLSGTPMLMINLMTMLVVVYAGYLGVETLVRMFEIYIFAVLFLYLTFIILLFASGVFEYTNLLPILENGWNPVIKAVFPLLLAFPFGEMIVFLTFFAYVNKKKNVIKTGVLSMATVAVMLTFVTILNIITLGVYLSKNSTFPTIETIRLINAADFVQRIDSIAVLIFMACGFAKVVTYFMAVNIGLKDLYRTENYKRFIIPIGLIILFGSVYNAESLSRHIYIGLRIVPFYINFPFEVVIPIILVFIIFIRNQFKKVE